MLVALIVAALPAWLSWLGGPFGWVLTYLLKKVGHAAIIELGNKFIGLRKAGEAASATESAKKLEQVLNNPNSTQKEIEDANKEFDDDYSRLIHLHH